MYLKHWNKFVKDILIMLIIFCFAIAYSCVIIRDSRNIDVKIGPSKEGTRDEVELFNYEKDTIK